MRKLLVPCVLLFSLASSGGAREGSALPAARVELDHSHAAWTAILQRHVKPDGFDYRALKQDPSPLKAYLATLEAVRLEDFRGWVRAERFAFWINAYNAYTIQRVADGYPVKSIKDLGSLFKSVWKQRFIPLAHLFPEAGGEELSLDEIEHRILRPLFRDARVHAAINCASKSCPPLLDRAYAASELDEQLDRQARAWLADESRNRFDPAQRTVHFSKIFDWFEEDFERDAGGVLAWVTRYAPAQHAEWLASKDLRVRHLEYDWSLNDTAHGEG